jgi:16S rRNA (guanine527-N7)-methyltransferase
MLAVTPAPWRSRLEDLVEAHRLDPAAAPRLASLLRLVRDDPTAPTTVREPEGGLEAHIADSLDGLLVPELRAARRIADLGSGAGFPGLPLAIARPHSEVHLVESLSRKCAFLERAIEAAEVANAHVACARAEEWPERELDAVTIRAVAPLAVLVEYAAPLLRIGGVLVAWKGRRDPDEEAAGEAAARIVGLELADAISIPPRPTAEHRTLHVYAKGETTPDRFPRRPGMARKRPLSP